MSPDTRTAAICALGIGILTAAACSDSTGPTDARAIDGPESQLAQTASSEPVTIIVGRPDLGTDYFPPGSHDESYHAQDAIRPRTTVVDAGTTVDFVIAAGHNAAVYEPGIAPEDIDLSLIEPPGTPFPFPPVINDPTGRLGRAALNFGPPVTWSWTFDEPGLYLVICEVLPHFADAKMYAWVRVR